MQTTDINKRKNQIAKIFWITIGWTGVSLFQYFGHCVLLQEVNCTLAGIGPWAHFSSHLFIGVWAGLIGGCAIVFLWEGWLRTKPYGWSLFYMVLSYTGIYLIVSIPAGLFYHINLTGQHWADPSAWQTLLVQYWNPMQAYNYLYWLFVVLATMIILLVNDKYGPGVFRDFLLGKYFRPKREERIFMFLDLRGSTTIAENLGDERYFNFINDVFKLATPPIIYSKGEIYQYVGDEIIISWKTEAGAQNANCLNCFFDIQKALHQKRQYFETHYQTQPEFKAGLHYGYVIAGEIGVVKRDIAFSGDVLNTTARIQAKCNELGVDILFSELLLHRLPQNTFEPKSIGKMALRGKQEQVLLFTV